MDETGTECCFCGDAKPSISVLLEHVANLLRPGDDLEGQNENE